MKGDVREWLAYAEDNLEAARLLMQQSLYNPCLQNIQQSIEKALKALLLEIASSYRKTHAVTELVKMLTDKGIAVRLSEDDCDLLDSIYLPSKYPLGGVLPDFDPDEELCNRCFLLAEAVLEQVRQELVG
jgi:HEPN domain-containing protein